MSKAHAHVPDDSPRRWASIRKLTLTPQAPAFRVPLAQCALAGTGNPVAYVRRRGKPHYLLRYADYGVEPDGSYLFVFDSLFFGLPAGRYAVELWQGNQPNREDCSVGQVCAEFEVAVHGPCTVDAHRIECVEANQPIIRRGDYPVANPIFDPIKDFSVQLCRVLEPGETVLPLKPSDKAALCTMVLCRPVELKLCDGIRVETVRFTGCVDGEPQFVRGVDGEGQYRFPKGATLTFDWTENNITAACEGC